MSTFERATQMGIDFTAPIAAPAPDHYRDPETERAHMAFLMIDTYPEKFRSVFRSWLRMNWRVWVRFEAEANKIWARGRTHYSARTIGEYLRHETILNEEPEGEFKLNDHYWPDLARIYVCLHPEREGFFETRKGQSAVRSQ